MKEKEIYKIGTKTYLVFKPTLSEKEVLTRANEHFKRKVSQLVAKKCIIQRDTLYLEGGKGTKVWAVWRA